MMVFVCRFIVKSLLVITMAGRVAARYISRRFSSGGKVLNEEEKAAENVYIKVLSFPFRYKLRM